MLKQQLEQLLEAALKAAGDDSVPGGENAGSIATEIRLAGARDLRHGDFVSNVALRSARRRSRTPLELAQAIVACLPAHPLVAKVAVARAGFINFWVSGAALAQELARIHRLASHYGHYAPRGGPPVRIVCVSVETTEMPHLQGARRAAYAASLANILAAAGIELRADHGSGEHDDDGTAVGNSAAAGNHGSRRECTEVRRIQSVTLFKGPEKMSADEQQSQFATAGQLSEAFGEDTCRLFFLMRSPDQPLDFDVRRAQARTDDNPAFHIQYAHARIASVLKQLAARGMAFDCPQGLANAASLGGHLEQTLLRTLTRYPGILEQAAQERGPHILAHYLGELANTLHTYYNAEQFIVPDAQQRNSRLALLLGVSQVIRNGLTLLGVSSPESM